MNSKGHKPEKPELRLVDVRTAAGHLGVSRWTVYHWARTGLLGSVKLGRRRLIEMITLEHFVRRGRTRRQLAARTRDSRTGKSAARRVEETRKAAGARNGPGS